MAPGPRPFTALRYLTAGVAGGAVVALLEAADGSPPRLFLHELSGYLPWATLFGVLAVLLLLWRRGTWSPAVVATALVLSLVGSSLATGALFVYSDAYWRERCLEGPWHATFQDPDLYDQLPEPGTHGPLELVVVPPGSVDPFEAAHALEWGGRAVSGYGSTHTSSPIDHDGLGQRWGKASLYQVRWQAPHNDRGAWTSALITLAPDHNATAGHPNGTDTARPGLVIRGTFTGDGPLGAVEAVFGAFTRNTTSASPATVDAWADRFLASERDRRGAEFQVLVPGPLNLSGVVETVGGVQALQAQPLGGHAVELAADGWVLQLVVERKIAEGTIDGQHVRLEASRSGHGELRVDPDGPLGLDRSGPPPVVVAAWQALGFEGVPSREVGMLEPMRAC